MHTYLQTFLFNDQIRYLALLDLVNTRYMHLISNPEGGETIDNESD